MSRCSEVRIFFFVTMFPAAEKRHSVIGDFAGTDRYELARIARVECLIAFSLQSGVGSYPLQYIVHQNTWVPHSSPFHCQQQLPSGYCLPHCCAPLNLSPAKHPAKTLASSHHTVWVILLKLFLLTSFVFILQQSDLWLALLGYSIWRTLKLSEPGIKSSINDTNILTVFSKCVLALRPRSYLLRCSCLERVDRSRLKGSKGLRTCPSSSDVGSAFPCCVTTVSEVDAVTSYHCSKKWLTLW